MCSTEDDKARSQSSRGRTATRSLECQEHGGNRQNTADGGQQTHGNVWNTWLEVVHANVLEVKVAVESTQPSRQRDQELRKRWVYVHEEFALDVLGREPTETATWSVAFTSIGVVVLTGLHRRRHC
jgi:hypothetical protein